MVDSTVKPRNRWSADMLMEHVNAPSCPCLLAGFVCQSGHHSFMHGHFDLARVHRGQGHP